MLVKSWLNSLRAKKNFINFPFSIARTNISRRLAKTLVSLSSFLSYALSEECGRSWERRLRSIKHGRHRRCFLCPRRSILGFSMTLVAACFFEVYMRFLGFREAKGAGGVRRGESFFLVTERCRWGVTVRWGLKERGCKYSIRGEWFYFRKYERRDENVVMEK